MLSFENQTMFNHTLQTVDPITARESCYFYKDISRFGKTGVVDDATEYYATLHDFIGLVLKESQGIVKNGILKRLLLSRDIGLVIDNKSGVAEFYVGKSKRKLTGKYVNKLISFVDDPSYDYLYIEMGSILLSNIFDYTWSVVTSSGVVLPLRVRDVVRKDNKTGLILQNLDTVPGLLSIGRDAYMMVNSELGGGTQYRSINDFPNFSQYLTYADNQKVSKAVSYLASVNRELKVDGPKSIRINSAGTDLELVAFSIIGSEKKLDSKYAYKLLEILDDFPPFYSILFDDFRHEEKVSLLGSKKCAEKGSWDLWFREEK